MKKACVIGWPAAHSRSPLIHGFWLRQHGIDGTYERQAVEPEQFPAFLRTMAAQGYAGGNVTLPHKEAAFRLADVCDAGAQAVAAVNTLWFESGRLHGANTDIYGFAANLDERAPGWDARPGAAVVLGAGGAARAVIRAVLDRGFQQIRLVNRTADRAEALAGLFGAAVRPVAWDERAKSLDGCDLLVNTTSLGMSGQAPLDLDLAALPARATVTDIVYAPLETALLKAAHARGNPVADGLGMLLHQAVPGFERWFGVRPAVTPELRALIVADLGRAV
jgi:shikimate dehydrogenase